MKIVLQNFEKILTSIDHTLKPPSAAPGETAPRPAAQPIPDDGEGPAAILARGRGPRRLLNPRGHAGRDRGT